MPFSCQAIDGMDIYFNIIKPLHLDDPDIWADKVMPLYMLAGGWWIIKSKRIYKGLSELPIKEKNEVIKEALSMGVPSAEKLILKRCVNYGGAKGNAAARWGGLLLPKQSNASIRRFVLRHELSHIKHWDMGKRLLGLVGVYVGIGYVGDKLSEYYEESRFAKIWKRPEYRCPIILFSSFFLSNYVHSFIELRADREAIDSPEMRDAAIKFFSDVYENNKGKLMVRMMHKLPNFLFRCLGSHPSDAERIAQAYRLFPRENA